MSPVLGTSIPGAATPGVHPSVTAPAPGPVANTILNVVSFGAVGDGKTDSTGPIQSALNEAHNLGGGKVYIPRGTYVISKPLVLYSHTELEGEGVDCCFLSLAAGSNCDMIHSFSFPGSVASEEAEGENNFSISHICLEGNRGTNVAPEGAQGCIGLYGSDFRLECVRVNNAPGNGIYSAFGEKAGEPFSTRGSTLETVKVANPAKNGIVWDGPGDTRWVNITVADAAEVGIWLKPRGNSQQIVNAHSWGEPAFCWLIQSFTNMLINCQADGGKTAGVEIQKNGQRIYGGAYFGAPIEFILNGVEAGKHEIHTTMNPSAGGTCVKNSKGDFDSSYIVHTEESHTWATLYDETGGFGALMFLAPVSKIYQLGEPGIELNGEEAKYKAKKQGFFGHAPVAQPAKPATLAEVITALENLGLVA